MDAEAGVVYQCPACLGALTAELHCARCGATYPRHDGIADFSGGRYYDQFDEQTVLSAEHRQALEREMEGAVARIADYYLPKIPPASRVLDAGCGNGVSVDLLRAAGHDAWGIDLSALRKWQWRERTHRRHLAVADGARLPFAGGVFDVVLCSGVLEHVGVAELGGEEYRVTVLPERDTARRAFLASLLRVLKPGGALYLDFPNGAFPIDFWHGTRGGAARFHSPREGFLPTAREVRALAGRTVTVTPISPNRRLRFKQVGQHWYGRAFAAPMQLFFALMDRVPWLAATALNPYLVLRLRLTASARER